MFRPFAAGHGVGVHAKQSSHITASEMCPGGGPIAAWEPWTNSVIDLSVPFAPRRSWAMISLVAM